VFSQVPTFYIPVHLDFRGRLNCIPEYLNYQSNSMAKSLLLFSKPSKVNKFDKQAIEYLKIYGATTFGLDKKSAFERLE
jgi:DNA-directed RNA polymerase